MKKHFLTGLILVVFSFLFSTNNALALEATNSDILPTVGTPPTVIITSHSILNTRVISGTVTISANVEAFDNVGIERVEFYYDPEIPIGTDTTGSPDYSVSWDTTSTGIYSSAYTITVKAYDNAGNIGTSQVVVIVDNSINSVTTPGYVEGIISITNPLQDTEVSGTVQLSAFVEDNTEVAKVKFYLDGEQIGTDVNRSPYIISWDTTTTGEYRSSYTLTAKAYNSNGNLIGTSTGVVIIVDNKDFCLNVNGLQTTGPCADTLCVAPSFWDILKQSCSTINQDVNPRKNTRRSSFGYFKPISLPSNGRVLGAEKFNFTLPLKFNSLGNEVTGLQKKLILDGYLKITTPTDYFGPLTLKAVKDYQSANGLIPDGTVGPLTRAVLNK